MIQVVVYVVGAAILPDCVFLKKKATLKSRGNIGIQASTHFLSPPFSRQSWIELHPQK